jgi:protein-disulfide isomerase
MSFRALFAAGFAAVAVSLVACGPSAPEGRSAFETADDRAKGSPDAPVTIVEYASVACGGCAAFHEAAMPTDRRIY